MCGTGFQPVGGGCEPGILPANKPRLLKPRSPFPDPTVRLSESGTFCICLYILPGLHELLLTPHDPVPVFIEPEGTGSAQQFIDLIRTEALDTVQQFTERNGFARLDFKGCKQHVHVIRHDRRDMQIHFLALPKSTGIERDIPCSRRQLTLPKPKCDKVGLAGFLDMWEISAGLQFFPDGLPHLLPWHRHPACATTGWKPVPHRSTGWKPVPHRRQLGAQLQCRARVHVVVEGYLGLGLPNLACDGVATRVVAEHEVIRLLMGIFPIAQTPAVQKT